MITRKQVNYKRKNRADSTKCDERLTESCLRVAYRLLKYRQRSESELRMKLNARFDNVIVDGVIDRLHKMRMVDDVTFARHWREQRETLNPRSRRMVCLELRKKGIDKEVISRVLNDFDDEENAYRAVKRKANALSKEGHDNFKRRMSAFLIRRGFNYEVTRRTVERLWSELS